jgi:hypothetical protein
MSGGSLISPYRGHSLLGQELQDQLPCADDGIDMVKDRSPNYNIIC